MEKTCFKCSETKPLDGFYKHPQMKDGHLNKCKECNKVDSSMRDPQKVKAYDKERSKNPKRKALFLVAQQRRRKANPDKMRAHNRVRLAIKAGKLVRPSMCPQCFMETKIVAHHEDYSKPLDVIWVCHPCHKRIHMTPRIPF